MSTTFLIRSLVLIIAFSAAEVHAAEDAPKAAATLDGQRMQFPEKGIAVGVKATIALLESCTDKSEATTADLRKAQDGDHVRLVFAKPVAVTIGNDKLETTEIVFTQPLNSGVFWLRVGDKVVRCTKYRFEKEKDFVAWRNEAQVAE